MTTTNPTNPTKVKQIPKPLIVFGSDHAGYKLKNQMINYAKDNVSFIELEDVGCYAEESCDYPDFAHSVARKVGTNPGAIGILVCGTGEGMAMTANKYADIRAGVAWNPEIATAIREHNNANVLCLPARHINLETAIKILVAFLETSPSEEQRHHRRINKINKI